MFARQEYERLRKLSEMPSGQREWLGEAEHSVEFLKSNATQPYVVLYASMPAVYICSVLAPTKALTPADADDLRRAHFTADQAWTIQRSYGGGEEHCIYLEPPLSHPGCKSLVGGEPLVVRRHFDGMKDYENQLEIKQKLVHSLNLFYMPERHAYSRLDDRGDIEDIILIFDERNTDIFRSRAAVLMDAKSLAEYMALSEQSLYRKFDFTRFDPGNFGDWGDHGRSSRRAPDLFYDVGIMPSHASFANGGQIIRSSVTVAEMVSDWQLELSGSNKQYEAFKILDRKNKCLVECSCSPESRDSYFVESEKPWDVSPAFFRSEVLAKYKADPDKYEIGERSITCRNAWYLKTYDINEAGQVHTYLVYLADLPYEEQQYWKLFNEWPKANISKRAFENDILGEFGSERQPLEGIKETVRS